MSNFFKETIFAFLQKRGANVRYELKEKTLIFYPEKRIKKKYKFKSQKSKSTPRNRASLLTFDF